MPTSVARAGRAARPLLLWLLIVLLPLESGLVPSVSGATTTPIPLSLGFSPSALYPVSDGVPVYTVGDTVWAESNYTSAVPLTLGLEGSSSMVAKWDMEPKTLVPVYTFTSSDPDGLWNISLATPAGTVFIPVRFVNLGAHHVDLGPFSYSLSSGELTISSLSTLGDSYDQEVCAAGNGTSAGVRFGLPTAMGESGNVTLTPGTPFRVAATGAVGEPFSFWFELYHSYALDVINSSNVVSEDLMAADSQPVVFSTNATTTTTLTWNAPIHEGRYDMRAYFQNSTSVDIVQESILVLTDSSWVSLTNACVPQPVVSSDIVYADKLTGGRFNWPLTFYVMYRTDGVEGVASFPVMANLSEVKFDFAPWNVTALAVNVLPSNGVLGTSQVGNSLFVLTSQYPNLVYYTLDINGEKDIQGGTAFLSKSYSTVTEQIPLGLLSVRVLSNGNLPTTLDVTGPTGVGVSSDRVGVNQSGSFLLPAGVYTVTGLQANKSQSAQTSVKSGLEDSLTLTFLTKTASDAGGTYATIEIFLIATAAVAAVANVARWLLRSRSLKARLAKA